MKNFNKIMVLTALSTLGTNVWAVGSVTLSQSEVQQLFDSLPEGTTKEIVKTGLNRNSVTYEPGMVAVINKELPKDVTLAPTDTTNTVTPPVVEEKKQEAKEKVVEAKGWFTRVWGFPNTVYTSTKESDLGQTVIKHWNDKLWLRRSAKTAGVVLGAAVVYKVAKCIYEKCTEPKVEVVEVRTTPRSR
jgi:hypothetical protein